LIAPDRHRGAMRHTLILETTFTNDEGVSSHRLMPPKSKGCVVVRLVCGIEGRVRICGELIIRSIAARRALHSALMRVRCAPSPPRRSSSRYAARPPVIPEAGRSVPTHRWGPASGAQMRWNAVASKGGCAAGGH
jgi:hypothetical protein